MTALIAGGLGAAGSIGSALIGSNASQNAASQQVAAQQSALAQQQKMFNTAQSTLSPYINAGTSVLPTLQSLITPGANQNATLSQIPGIQFQSQYGNMAATNALAAHGQASGGALATAVSQYNQGLASTNYQNIVGDLQNYANMGSNSANALAGYAINSGNAQANTYGNIGNAQASGTLGSANALSNGLAGTGNALSSAALYSALANNSGLYGTPSIYNGAAIGQAAANI